MDETVERCAAIVEQREAAQHVVLNAAKVVMMADVPELRTIVRQCALVNADGQSVVWAARLLGHRVPERVAGIDLMHRLLQRAEKAGWPVYFLGARQEVLDRCISACEAAYPALVIAGAHHGYFTDDAAMADAVRESGARLLFVGISSPRKELFLAEQRDRLGPLLAVGVGGAFDVVAGLTRRAPVWMQRTGLEWLYRFMQEPRRMWRRYLVGNLRFVGMVLAEALRRTRRGAGTNDGAASRRRS